MTIKKDYVRKHSVSSVYMPSTQAIHEVALLQLMQFVGQSVKYIDSIVLYINKNCKLPHPPPPPPICNYSRHSHCSSLSSNNRRTSTNLCCYNTCITSSRIYVICANLDIQQASLGHHYSLQFHHVLCIVDKHICCYLYYWEHHSL